MDRISILKSKIAEEERFVSMEQAQIITRVFKNTEGEPRAIRRAKSFFACCIEIPIYIDPLELIVGNRTPGRRAGVVFPEAGIKWLDEELENLPFREQDKFNVRKEDIVIFRKEILPYWKGKSLEDTIKRGKEGKEIKRTEKVLKINQKDHAQGHILPDVDSWLKFGPAGILQEFESAKSKETDPGKIQFCESVCISLNGGMRFIGRYSKMAKSLAKEARRDFRRSCVRHSSSSEMRSIRSHTSS